MSLIFPPLSLYPDNIYDYSYIVKFRGAGFGSDEQNRAFDLMHDVIGDGTKEDVADFPHMTAADDQQMKRILIGDARDHFTGIAEFKPRLHL